MLTREELENHFASEDRDVIRMLYEGVGYHDGGSFYRFGSHEGDLLGTVHVQIVNTVLFRLKRLGVVLGRDCGVRRGEQPGVTLAWNGRIDWSFLSIVGSGYESIVGSGYESGIMSSNRYLG